MKKLLSALGLILALTILVNAQTTGLKVNDLFRFKRVSDPQVSPDGKTVSYVVTVYDKETNKRANHIHLMPISGGESQVLADGGGKDSRPRWSPDGKQLAFISSREGSSQIWIFNTETKNTQKLTNIFSEASDLVWSPDGKHLLFTSEVYPECADEDCNKKKLTEAENSKVKAKIADRLLYRHWNSWKEGKRSHLFIVSANGGTPLDLTPGDYDTPPFSLGGPDNYAFSPDGKEVCFARNTDKVEAISTNNDLFVVSIKGGEAKRITTNQGSDTNPLYSPDGRFIAYRSQERAGFEADRFRLMLYDRATGKSRSISESLDRAVDEFIWSPDSKKIYFTAIDFGYIPIYVVDIASGEIKKIADKSCNSELAITNEGNKLVFTRSTMKQPSEVFSLKLENMVEKQLTSTNSELLAKRELVEGEDVYSVSPADGEKIHSILVKPIGFEAGKKYPMVVLIHGGPQGAWEHNFGYRWNANIYASAGYVVLMPNPRGSIGYGQKFTDQISGDWGGKCYQDIMSAVDHAISLGYVDKNKIGAAGGSFGGYMVNWILGHTDRFKALVSHAGVYNLVSMYGVTEELWFTDWEFKGTPWTNRELYDKFSPSNFVKNFKTPTLVIHGELDYRVPVGEGLQLFTALQRMDVPSRLLYFPDEGHWVLKPQNSELWYNTVLDWFKTHLN
jgi:dipeptidyl aminopeptidase/acylaminoacyl peptidase